MTSHLFPDVIVAKEAAHLSFGQSAPRKGVIVTREEVYPQNPNVTAV